MQVFVHKIHKDLWDVVCHGVPSNVESFRCRKLRRQVYIDPRGKRHQENCYSYKRYNKTCFNASSSISFYVPSYTLIVHHPMPDVKAEACYRVFNRLLRVEEIMSYYFLGTDPDPQMVQLELF